MSNNNQTTSPSYFELGLHFNFLRMNKLILFIGAYVLMLFPWSSCVKNDYQLEEEDCKICIGFSSVPDFFYMRTSSQTNYGAVIFSEKDILFRYKYANNDSLSTSFGDVEIMNVDSTTYNHDNFIGNIHFQGNINTQIDFTNYPFTNKVIEFDIVGSPLIGLPNAFFINGGNLNVLPSGCSASYTSLSNGIHYVLSGPINTIEIKGFKVAIDNLCIDKEKLNF